MHASKGQSRENMEEEVACFSCATSGLVSHQAAATHTLHRNQHDTGRAGATAHSSSAEVQEAAAAMSWRPVQGGAAVGRGWGVGGRRRQVCWILERRAARGRQGARQAAPSSRQRGKWMEMHLHGHFVQAARIGALVVLQQTRSSARSTCAHIQKMHAQPAAWSDARRRARQAARINNGQYGRMRRLQRHLQTPGGRRAAGAVET